MLYLSGWMQTTWDRGFNVLLIAGSLDRGFLTSTFIKMNRSVHAVKWLYYDKWLRDLKNQGFIPEWAL